MRPIQEAIFQWKRVDGNTEPDSGAYSGDEDTTLHYGTLRSIPRWQIVAHEERFFTHHKMVQVGRYDSNLRRFSQHTFHMQLVIFTICQARQYNGIEITGDEISRIVDENRVLKLFQNVTKTFHYPPWTKSMNIHISVLWKIKCRIRSEATNIWTRNTDIIFNKQYSSWNTIRTKYTNLLTTRIHLDSDQYACYESPRRWGESNALHSLQRLFTVGTRTELKIKERLAESLLCLRWPRRHCGQKKVVSSSYSSISEVGDVDSNGKK